MTAFQHPKYRTKSCRNSVSGSCPYGDKCNFIHSDTTTAPAGIVPYSLLSQQIVDWNVYLPQLLALSAQQASLKNKSPPRPQGLHLIDQDPSPPTSLILSKSDATTSSDPIPKNKRSKRRKRRSCKHFLRTGGWCPAGTKCKFHHDVAGLPSAALRKAEHSSPSENSAQGRTISGGVLMSVQVSSPPAVSHDFPEPPPCAEAQSAPLCSPPYYSIPIFRDDDISDRAIYWPDSTWQVYQATASATTTAVPVPPIVAQTSLVPHSVYLPPQAQASTNETQSSLPTRAYEVNGTTYFTPTMPSAPPPVTYPVSAQPALYGQPVPPPYPYYAPPVLPAGYYEISNQTACVRLQTSFDPFGSERMVPRELPILSRPEENQMQAIRHDGFPLAVSSPSSTLTKLIPMDATITITNEAAVGPMKGPEFPYQPPKHQSAGHARRISINIKKHDRSHSG